MDQIGGTDADLDEVLHDGARNSHSCDARR
jgi:hypothetical protein